MSLLSSLMKRQLVGLDIGVSGIKAVELAGSKTPRLMAYNRIALPWDTVSAEGEVKRPDILISALKKLFQSGGFSSKRVAVGAFGKTIMTKKITIAKMTYAELQHQLYWEAEQYIPYNINEVNVDCAILGDAVGTSTGAPMMDVLLVAAKKDFVATLKGLIQEAGLEPVLIDSQAFALGNVFEFNYGHRFRDTNDLVASVLLDFGAGSTKVSMVEGDKTTFARELQQCGTGCTQALMDRLSISFEDAEKSKIYESSRPEVATVIHEFCVLIAEEISRTIDFYLSQSLDRSIQGVFVCGGGSKLEGLTAAVEKRVGVSVQKLNPIQNIAGGGQRMNAAAVKELSYLGSVAIGLGLREAGDGK